jgi:hypothetical protein
VAVLLLRLHVISEETSKRLDKVPSEVRVLVMRRPKYTPAAHARTPVPMLWPA